VFNPNHEIFQSYFRRGMPKPEDARIGDVVFYGMLDMAEVIVRSVEKCPLELQPHLYSQIILSGGNFCWTPPPVLSNVACDAQTKVALMLREKGVESFNVTVSPEPQYAVWRGCIVYGYALPTSFEWSWERLEGWFHHR
jgi:crenactin